MKLPLICLLIFAVAILACAQTPKTPTPEAGQASAPKDQTPAAQKPAAYPLTEDQSRTIINLATVEQQAIGEVLSAEQSLRSARFERKNLQSLLGEKLKLDSRQVMNLTNALLATNQWQEADDKKQAASKAVLAWLNDNRPKDCPECQLSRDLRQWLRQ